MRRNFFLSLAVAIAGIVLPVFAHAAGIDASNYQSRLCSNSDCSTYTNVNWRTTNGTAVTVTDSALTGYIWSSDFGWINLSPTNGGVNNTTSGVLSGYAWGAGLGWINFNPTHGGVTINTSTGEFSGYAWASGAGWMRFDCSLGSDACVKTDWRPSSDDDDDYTPPPLRCTDRNAINYGGTPPCRYSQICEDTAATNYGGALPCTYTTRCIDTAATNYGSTGQCVYPATCQDPSALNYRGSLPCTYNTEDDCSGSNCEETCTDPSCDVITDTDNGDDGDTDDGTDDTGTDGDTGGGSGGDSGGGGGFDCDSIIADPNDPLDVIGSGVKQSYCETVEAIKETKKKIGDILDLPTADTIAKAIATAGVVAGAVASVVGLLFINPISFSEIFLIPVRLWSLLMTAFGLKKRRRPWGTVYDSVTKQPLDPAYVVLRTAEGVEVANTLTDLDGRYGFIIPAPGTYALVASKTNYKFPSQKLVGYDHDELYRDLYFGEYFTATSAGEVVIRNIPMDPEKFDWNEFAKKDQRLMRFYQKRNKWLFRVADILFGIGFTVAAIALLAAPKLYNIAVFGLYVLVYFIKKYGTKQRPFGYVGDKASGKPLSFAIIRISSVSTGVEIMHRITDATGRYYCLLPNGQYRVRIDRKLPDGTYQTIAKDLPATVDKGYLARAFEV